MNGKGDTPRPLSVPRKTFDDNWDLAFGSKLISEPKASEDAPLGTGLYYDVKPLEPNGIWMKKKAELYERYMERHNGLGD